MQNKFRASVLERAYSKRNITFYGILALIGILLFAYFFLITAFLNSPKYKSEIKSYIIQKALVPVDPGKISVGLTWNLGVSLKTDKFIIKKQDNSKFINVGKTYVEISLLPIIKKQVIIRKIVIDKVDADITRFEDGTFDVSKIFAIKQPKSKYKVRLENTEIRLNNYNIKFNDNYIIPAKEILLNGEYIRLARFTPDKFVEVTAKGTICEQGKQTSFYDVLLSTALPINRKDILKNRIKTKGEVINFNLADFKPYLDKYIPDKFAVLTGKGSANFDMDLNTQIFGFRNFFVDSLVSDLEVTESSKKGGKNILFHKEPLNIITGGAFDDKDLYLNTLQVKGGEINVEARGKINNYKDRKSRNVDLRIDVNNSRAKVVAEIFPKNIRIPKDPFNKIVKYNMDGNASGNISIKGFWRKPDLFGKIKYDDVSFFGESSPDTKGFGSIDFLGPILVLNCKQKIGQDKFISVTGSVNPLKNKNLKLAVSTTQNIDYYKALPLLLAIRDIFEFKLGPVQQMDIKGTGKVNLDISGSFKKVKINGYVQANDASIKYETLAGRAENVNGKLKFDGDKVIYDEVVGFVDGLKVIPSGYTTLPPKDSSAFSDVKLYIPKLDLQKAQKFVYGSPLLAEVQIALKDLIEAKGTADAEIFIKGTEKDTKSNGILKFSDVYVKYNGYSEPFNNLKGQFRYDDKKIYFDDVSGTLLGNNAKINGSSEVLKKYVELTIVSDKINLEDARNFIMNSSLLYKTQEVVKDFISINGTSALKLDLKGDTEVDPLKNMVLSNIRGEFVHKLTGYPIKIKEGALNITSDTVETAGIKAEAANSDFEIKGKVFGIKNNMKKKTPLIPDLEAIVKDFNASGFEQVVKTEVIPDKLKKNLSKFAGKSGTASVFVKLKPQSFYTTIDFNNFAGVYKSKDIPVSIEKGKVEITDKNVYFWNLNGRISDSAMFIKGYVQNYVKKPYFEITSNLDLNSEDINKFNGIFKGSGLEKEVLPVYIKTKGNFDKCQVQAKTNFLNIYGSIDKLLTDEPVFKDFSIKTTDEKPLSSCVLNTCLKQIINSGNEKFISEGTIQADFTMNGYVLKPDIQGFISFAGIKVPDYKLNMDNVIFNFGKDALNIDFKGFKIDDSSLNIKAKVDYPLQIPFMVKDISITSDYFNVDNIAGIYSANKNLINNNIQDVKLPYFVIQKGKLETKELILLDLITSNVNADITYTPDWLLSVSNININATGGTGTGNLYYNTKSTELSLNLSAKDMQANALATTFFNIPNEVYGTLEGESQFYTKGRNMEEIISNLNGYAHFRINDGRLVRLGSLEYFLRAANVVQSGIGGFNFNNIVDLVAPQKTGYFNYLEGRIDLKEGVIHTEDITSSGNNLSLLISGDFDMLTNNSEVKILGKLSKKVSGLLGPLGSVSINQFIGYIPGFGFMPSSAEEKGLMDYLPGLSKIPLLGLDSSEKYRQFAVDINGDLYDPKSVKSFRWLE